MKFKNLLSLGAMLSCGLVAQAQVPVFHESFEAEQSKQPTDLGYYEKINMEEGDDWSLSSDGFSGKCFNFFNNFDFPNTGNWWRRAVKFRNLPLEAGKSYRLTFRFKGSNIYSDAEGKDQKSQMKVGLMQGVENADISILGAIDKDQYRIVSYFNDTDYEKYSLMYYFADKENQDAKYDANCSAKEEYNEANKNQYFATFNVFNSGEYYLDEVNLEEANIAGMKYHFDVVCVDLGYATNAASLAGTKGYYVLPNESATVKVNGTEAVVEAVELRSDGKLYVFLKEAIEDGAEVEVSFTNPEGSDFKYAADAAIQGAVLNFAEKAELDEAFNPDGEITSWLYGVPVLESTTPLNGSFALDGNISEFTFTFDKEVYSVANSSGEAPVATLSDGTVLKLKEGTPETTKTLTFVREGADLGKGSYSVTVENIVTAVGTEGQDVILNFEVGKVQLAETVYEDICQTLISGENGGIPEGWTCMVKGTAGDWTSGEVWGGGSACRNMDTKGQMMFYLCDRDGFTYLMYGDKEDARLTLPAGDIEFSIMGVGHEDPSRTLEFRLEDMDGNQVAYASGNTSVQAENFTTIEDAGAISVRFNNPKEQNLILKIHEPQGGFTAARVIGFKAQSYSFTEGDKENTEIIAQGSFAAVGGNNAPAHGTGWKIYRQDGRMRDPGANCSWGGNDWTGGGGPRVMTMSNKGMDGAAIYLAGGAYATYGEYEVQTDHNGALEGDIPEKTLDLKKAQYQMTYHIIGWKNPGPEYFIQLDIYNMEDGIKGTPVYTRKDVVTEACGSGTDGASDAKKVQFLWNAPLEGKYILKFTAGGEGEGEACVGNVKVETTSSLAVTYSALMKKNLVPAIEELKLAMENDNYRGETRDKLNQIVKDNTDPDYHTVDEYTKAFAEIEAITKKSAKRRANIDKYPEALAAVEKGLNDATGTKHEALEQFPIVQKAYNDYKDVDYIAMDDETLQKAVDEMGNNGSLISNMVSTCVPLLTKQMVDLSAAIVNLDEAMVNHSYVIAAGNAISDDQELVNKLKTVYAAKLYKKIADGFNFSEFDEDMQDDVEVTIPASFLIQNANFYNTTVIPAGMNKTPASVNDFPGWEVELVSGTIQSVWDLGWGQKGASAVKPVEDCAVTSPWGESEYSAKQLVTMLPVAKYNASINVASDAADAENTPQHIAFVDDNEKQWEGTPKDDGSTTWSRDSQDPVVFEGITPAVDGNYASLTIGAKLTKACFGKIDNATLTIVGKAEGFDYAAAAAALADEVAASIENAPAAPEGAPASVAYYDLSGRQVAQPQGVAIKVEKWANGYTKVSKVVIK